MVGHLCSNNNSFYLWHSVPAGLDILERVPYLSQDINRLSVLIPNKQNTLALSVLYIYFSFLFFFLFLSPPPLTPFLITLYCIFVCFLPPLSFPLHLFSLFLFLA